MIPRDAEYYLEIKARVDESMLIKLVPLFVKIASSPEDIDRINSSLQFGVLGDSGVPLILTVANKTPARAHTRRDDFAYFKLEKTAPGWNDIEETRLITICVPDEIPDEVLLLYGSRGHRLPGFF